MSLCDRRSDRNSKSQWPIGRLAFQRTAVNGMDPASRYGHHQFHTEAESAGRLIDRKGDMGTSLLQKEFAGGASCAAWATDKEVLISLR